MSEQDLVIRGAGGGGGKGRGGGSRVAVEQPNTMQSRALARLVDLIGAGPIQGLVDGAKSIYFDETPLQNEDETFNFEGIAWDARYGDADQDYLPGFSEVESEVAVDVQVKSGAPVTRSITDQDLDAIRVTVQIPCLYQQNQANGDILRTPVAWAFEISTDGGPWERVVEKRFTGKTMSPVEISHRIPLPSGSKWDVRMVRLLGDSTSAALRNDTWWSRYTRITDAKMVCPDTALIGIQVDSALFGNSVPQRAYDIYGRVIKVPSNYDPVKRTYNGLWDGTFKNAWSDNPAWCLYDLLTDPIDGLGRELTASRVDKWGLYAIAQYCDESVPDGQGGFEPRFTCNGSINVREDAFSAIAAFAGAFRILVFFSAGMVFFSQDRPQNAKRLLTPANVIDGIFTYEGTGLKARHSVALVSWLNPDDGFRPAIEVVEDPDAIADYGWRSTDEIALFCTSRGQAWRQGAMLLDAERHCTETVSFSAGLDCADIMPGDVVAIADPAYAGVRAGGRLLQCARGGAVLDAPFPFEEGQNYKLSVTMPDGTLRDIDLIPPASETDTVAFRTPVEDLPAKNAVYVIMASNLAPRLFRIMSIEEAEGITFNFVGLLYDPGKYDRVEKGISLPPTPTTALPGGPLQVPEALDHAEYIYLKGGLSPMAAMTLSWTCSDPRATTFQLQWRTPGSEEFDGRLTVDSASVNLDIDAPGLYTFRVRAVDALGRCSGWATRSVNAQALWTPPKPVEGFLGEVHGDLLTLKWAPSPDLHVAHYEIRLSRDMTGHATWQAAEIISQGVSKQTCSFTTTLQVGVYMIRAVSIKGIASATPTILTNGLGADMAGMNVVERVTQEPTWGGAMENVVRNGSLLHLRVANETTYETHGVYRFDPDVVDLSQVFDARLIPGLVFHGGTMNEDIYGGDDVYAIPNIYAPSSSAAMAVRLEYSIVDPDGPASGNAPVWADWVALVEPVTIRARYFRFRLVLDSLDGGYTTPIIGRAEVVIDMPDRVVSVQDFMVPASAEGYAFEFDPPFKATPAISPPLIQDGQEGDSYRITDKSRSGFTLHLLNRSTGSEVPVSRKVDWIAKGYGAEVAVTPSE